MSQNSDSEATSVRPGSLSFITNETSDVISHDETGFKAPEQKSKVSDAEGLDTRPRVNTKIGSTSSDRSLSTDADDRYSITAIIGC